MVDHARRRIMSGSTTCGWLHYSQPSMQRYAGRCISSPQVPFFIIVSWLSSIPMQKREVPSIHPVVYNNKLTYPLGTDDQFMPRFEPSGRWVTLRLYAMTSSMSCDFQAAVWACPLQSGWLIKRRKHSSIPWSIVGSFWDGQSIATMNWDNDLRKSLRILVITTFCQTTAGCFCLALCKY